MAQSARNLEDTFPSFARKLQNALGTVHGVQKRLDHCAKQNIRYSGSPVSRVLLSGACTYVGRIDERAHALLMRLEHKFGKEVLTSKYNNLVRILQICQTNWRASRNSRAAPRAATWLPRYSTSSCGPANMR